MKDGKDHPIARKVKERLPAAYIGATLFREDLSVHIHREKLIPVCRLMRDDPELNFDFPIHVTSVDYPKDSDRFEIVYEFFSIRLKHQVRLKTRVPEDDCEIESITGIWVGANYLEREVYDMMGIRFLNHPELKRILLPDEYDEGFPLRKNFPIQGRGWRDTFDFPR
ncbi:NADH-quinone oxidoreductase subunit C [Nitrospira defluvii]|nr:NADH-quinone oxidoreductase subunit C [Nitrospira defluvii]